MTRFRSKTDGYNRAVRHWICRRCDMPYMRTKPREGCGQCGGKEWDYLSSRREFVRWNHLSLLRRQGLITQLEIHPRYAVDMCGKRIWIEADFAYQDNGKRVIEDVKPKGKATDTGISQLKRLVLQDKLGLVITVVEI